MWFQTKYFKEDKINNREERFAKWILMLKAWQKTGVITERTPQGYSTIEIQQVILRVLINI